MGIRTNPILNVICRPIIWAAQFAVRGYVEECGLDDSPTAEHGAGTIFQHPDTKYSFAGNGIQNWASVKSQIEQIANKLIDFKDIALDIAITKDNVLLVEFNFRYGIEHQQCVVGGVRQILGVPNH